MSEVCEFWKNGFKYFTIDLGDGEARMCLSKTKKTTTNIEAYFPDTAPVAKVFYVDFIKVSPQYRNGGYGKELLQACIRWADITKNVIILDAIPLDSGIDQHRLLRFYLSHGFKFSSYKNNKHSMYYHSRNVKRKRKVDSNTIVGV